MATNPGPPKKPTALKLLEGTYRADRVSKNEPRPKIEAPEPPECLSGEALKEWQRIVKELFVLGLMTRIDRAALAAYCQAWADFHNARERVEAAGLVLKTVNGNFQENPFYTIQKRSMELMHKFLTEFGMTPASRTRINGTASTAPDSDDPAEKYFGT